ncbi:MAG TPA: ATP-binding protein [Syntrophobacteraceae bacterium]|nr:ATP-binding protein [Syntrophobacteraceae bacterium]
MEKMITGKGFFALTSLILKIASEGLSEIEFFRRVLSVLLDHTPCDRIGVTVAGPSSRPFALAVSRRDHSLKFLPGASGEATQAGESAFHGDPADYFGFLPGMRNTAQVSVHGHISGKGSFWTNDAEGCFSHQAGRSNQADLHKVCPDRDCRSLALVPLEAGEAGSGYLQFGIEHKEGFNEEIIEFLEHATQVVSAALYQWHVTWSLKERVKELSCLYRIAGILDAPSKPLEEMLCEIVRIIPGAYLHENVAAARITFDGKPCATEGFEESTQRQSAKILINGQQRGLLEVTYPVTMPELDEGPFLHDERKLLDTIALELSSHIERWLYEKEQQEIKEKMRHSNRLAIIGQLAAAVAHEINEPLTTILGFAQLAKKGPRLPAQTASDLEKIVATSLHVREIVRKLLMYGRKMPQRASTVELNKIVKEGISFFDHRLAREKISVELDLGAEVGEITLDPGHLRQVVANIFLNALQAVTHGGKITIRTARTDDGILLTISDTGCGMNPEIKDKIFIPFFTTKGPHEGTGLGLSVVLDIVKGLGGSIHVDSEPGVGTRVQVMLPVAAGREGFGGSSLQP